MLDAGTASISLPPVLVIGATGLVGRALVRDLSAHGRSVLAASRMPASSGYRADLCDVESLRAVIRPGMVVVNAAGYANATDDTVNGRKRFESANVTGLRNLARVAGEVGAAHLVHLSSIAAMGRWSGAGIDESQRRPPVTPYARSKFEGEEILRAASSSLPVTILRPTSVFGEGRGLARMLCSLLRLPVIPLPGGGRAEIPFTYIGNVTHAVSLTLNNPACFGRTFIVGDETSYSLREVLSSLGTALHREPVFVPVPVALARLGVFVLEAWGRFRQVPPLLDRGRLHTLTNSVSYSIQSFQDATGYVPPVSLAEAAARIARGYQREREK